MSNYFIVIDGPDGAGKTTLIKSLINFYQEKFYILWTKEPSTSYEGKEARRLSNEYKNITNEKEKEEQIRKIFDYMIKDRERHNKELITPFLDNSLILDDKLISENNKLISDFLTIENEKTIYGDYNSKNKILICDRYYYSTFAYQGSLGIPINEICERCKDFKKPNLAILLYLPGDTATERVERRLKDEGGKKEGFESENILERASYIYRNFETVLKDNKCEYFLEGEKIVYIDASQSKEKVFQEAKRHLDEIIKD